MEGWVLGEDVAATADENMARKKRSVPSPSADLPPPTPGEGDAGLGELFLRCTAAAPSAEDDERKE